MADARQYILNLWLLFKAKKINGRIEKVSLA